MEPSPIEQIARTTRQVGAAIRRRRRALKLSQTQLGEKAGLRQATISVLESGDTGTQLRTLVDVLAALGLEMVIRDRSQAGETIEQLF